MAGFDINHAKFTGTVERFDRIATKTGTPMVRVLLRCYRESVSVVAFKDLAKDTDLAPGDRVEVRGNIQSTSWTAPDGTRRQGWQVVSDYIGPIAEQVEQHDSRRGVAPPPAPPAPTTTRPSSPTKQATGKRRERQVRMFNSADPGPFDYQDGPF